MKMPNPFCLITVNLLQQYKIHFNNFNNQKINIDIFIYFDFFLLKHII